MPDKNNMRVTFRLSMTLGLAGTIAAGIWWASAFTQEVRKDLQTIQSNIETNREHSEDVGRQVFGLRVRAAANDATGKAVQQRLNSIDNILQRIERKIDRATQGGTRQ